MSAACFEPQDSACVSGKQESLISFKRTWGKKWRQVNDSWDTTGKNLNAFKNIILGSERENDKSDSVFKNS